MIKFLVRVMASTIVRRLTLLALVAVLGWVGMGKAHAQYATEPEAQAACQARRTELLNQCSGQPANWAGVSAVASPSGSCNKTVNGGGGAYHLQNFACSYPGYGQIFGATGGPWTYNTACPAGTEAHTGQCRPLCVAPQVRQPSGTCKEPCPDRPDMNVSGWGLRTGDVVCFDSCEAVQMSQSAGGSQVHLGTTCSGDPSCPAGYGSLLSNTQAGTTAPSAVCRATDTDDDGTPDGDDDFPTDPGEDTDSDGDGTGDKGDHAPDDPTDGADTEGEEDGDDEGDNVSTGGGTCVSAPQSTGDGILTQIAFQAWKTRCALERLTTTDGKLKIDGTGLGGGGNFSDNNDYDGNSNGTPDYLEGEEQGDGDASDDGLGEDTGPGDGIIGEDREFGGDAGLDETGLGLSRACPTIPPIDVLGQTIEVSTAEMCDVLGALRYLLMLLATLASLRILMPSGAI